MNLPDLPKSAFVDPLGRNKNEIEKIIQQTLNLLLTHLQQASENTPLPDTSNFPDCELIPQEHLSERVLFAELKKILAHSMNPANPAYIGHMDSVPTVMSFMGEMVSAAINNNMLSHEMSPSLSELESRLLKMFAKRFGLGDHSGGVMTSGGSLANLHALAVARNAKFNTLKTGINEKSIRPVLFASEAAHTSVQKAAMILGLGTSSVIQIKTNQNSQMETEALKNAIEKSLKDGYTPFCIVATAGTTTTGNIDPLNKIGEIARSYDLWFQVDAAYGGALVFSKNHRQKITGIEYADSITFNPQKWLYIAKTCAMVLFRDIKSAIKAFRVSVPYMTDDDNSINLGEIGVQGTRHAEVLKLWLSLLHIGVNGYDQLIENSYSLTEYFEKHVRKRKYLELAGKPEINLVCFRGVPSGVSNNARDLWNTKLQAFLLNEGQIFLSLPLYRGSRWLRAVFLNPYTDEKKLDHIFECMDRFAKKDE